MGSISTLRIHHFEPSSQSNGPGRRAVLWFQGCTLNCPGCFNPHTHPHRGGKTLPISTILTRLACLAREIEGITISGGEPLQQIQPLIQLLSEVRRKFSFSTILFTGYEMDEIHTMPLAKKLPDLVDVLIAGRYNPDQRIAKGLIGSGNKSVHYFTNRYAPHDLAAVPEAEILVAPNGRVLLTGISPLEWL